MKNRPCCAVLAIPLVLLGLLLGACGAQPGLPLEEEAYRSEEGGFTIRYPKGWKQEGYGSDVTFFESDEIAEESVPSVPMVYITGGSLTDIPAEMGNINDSRSLLEAFNQTFSAQGMEVEILGDTKAGPEKAAMARIKTSESGEEMVGRIVAVYLGDRGILILSAGKSDAWDKFVPTFESMLASMTFFEP